MNWVSILFACILVWAIYQGYRRGFAQESGSLIARIISIITGICGILFAWWGSQRLQALAISTKVAALPHWAGKIIAWWQQSPRIAELGVFIIIYIVISNLVSLFLGRLPMSISKRLPQSFTGSHFLGAILGIATGVVRVIILGAIAYSALQYFSVGKFGAVIEKSQPYDYLSTTLYRPYVYPIIRQELPVLARGALEPLAQNVSLFVLPTGRGRETGVLVIAPQIRSLAEQVTAGQTNKAKAIYDWEIHHIHYDWKKYDDYVYRHKWDQQSPLQTVQSGKGVCADYALLYADMANAVGLTVKIDEGLGGVNGQLGSHAWNEVYVTSLHRFIYVDTTWGSQQNQWFNAPNFNQTHVLQTSILVQGRN